MAASTEKLGEREWLIRHLGGDTLAFAELLAAYQSSVFGYLVRCGVPAASRDDLFQDVFIRIHRHAHSYHPDKPLKPWIFAIVANVVRSFYRAKRVEELVFEEDRLSADATVHQEVEARETAQWLRHSMDRLPWAQREVLALCGFEGFAVGEVAGMLEMPLATVKTHLRRGRLALTRALARRKLVQQREVSS